MCGSNCNCDKCCPECDVISGDGCLNDSLPLECTHYSGVDIDSVGITKADSGDEAIQKLANAIKQSSGADQLVKISEKDTETGYLESKIRRKEGSNITLTKINTGNNEYLEIAVPAFPEETSFLGISTDGIKYEGGGTKGHAPVYSLKIDPNTNPALSLGSDGLKLTIPESPAITTTPSSTVEITPSGTLGHTLTANAKISTVAGNSLVNNEGLYVASVSVAQTLLTTNNSSTLTLSTSGNNDHTLTGAVKISAIAGNSIVDNQGLYATEFILNKATPTILGGVKVGPTLKIDNSGVLDANPTPLTGLISTGGVILAGTNVTIASDIVWKIDGVIYTKSTPSSFNVNTSTPGTYRKDLIYANTSGGLVIVQGVEDPTVAVAPALPANSVEVAIVDISGSIIQPPVPVFPTNYWTTEGNTVDSSRFIGTINANPFIVKTNNLERMRVNPTGGVAIGGTITGNIGATALKIDAVATATANNDVLIGLDLSAVLNSGHTGLNSFPLYNVGGGLVNGTYTNVSITVNGNSTAKATFVVAGGGVSSVTITERGIGYTPGSSTIPVSLLGGAGSPPSGTITAVNIGYGNLTKLGIRQPNGDNLFNSDNGITTIGAFSGRSGASRNLPQLKVNGGAIVVNDFNNETRAIRIGGITTFFNLSGSGDIAGIANIGGGFLGERPDGGVLMGSFSSHRKAIEFVQAYNSGSIMKLTPNSNLQLGNAQLGNNNNGDLGWKTQITGGARSGSAHTNDSLWVGGRGYFTHTKELNNYDNTRTAILDLESTNQGFLMPRVTTLQRDQFRRVSLLFITPSGNNFGAGYTSTPTVTITGNGTGATAVANMGYRPIFTITNGGTGYGADVRIRQGGTNIDAVAVVTGGVITSITVPFSMISTTNNPVYQMVGTGVTGTGFTYTVTHEMVVASATVTNGGKDYTTAAVTVTGGGATLQANINYVLSTLSEATKVYNLDTKRFNYYDGTQWVDMVIGGGGGSTYTANNGLTMTGTNSTLGGTLGANTTIDSGTFTLNFDKTASNSTPAVRITSSSNGIESNSATMAVSGTSPSLPGWFVNTNSQTFSIKQALQLTRNMNVNATFGNGVSLDYQLSDATKSLVRTGRISNYWINPENTGWTSAFEFQTLNNSTNALLETKMTIYGDGKLRLHDGASEFADNAAALAGGLNIGTIYRTGDLLKIVH